MSNRQILLSFYGDDFTGTAATAETLTAGGVPTVMFLEPPTLSFLQSHFPGIQAVGVPGIARSLEAGELEKNLSPIFKKMKRYRAPLFLYKVCSTFDSSPRVGSIGKAVEVGRKVFSSEVVPMLPAAPRLGRFTVFGHHFAAMGSEVFRLDRHPSMSVHPVTPMKESDLRRHLAEQTDLACGLVPAPIMDKGKSQAKKRVQNLVRSNISLILFDTLFERHIKTACSLMWDHTAKGKTLFCIGSQEMGYGLVAQWKRLNLLRSNRKSKHSRAGRKAEQILVISGSCASVTERQIKWAVANGFAKIRIHPDRLFEADERLLEIKHSTQAALNQLGEGKSVVLYSALGPKDASIFRTKHKIKNLGLNTQAITERLGHVLGQLIKAIVSESGVKRLVLVGGDVSGRIMPELGIWALQVGRPVGIAAPLCYAYSFFSEINGTQIALKGGQVGEDNYFNAAWETRMPDFTDVALGKKSNRLRQSANRTL